VFAEAGVFELEVVGVFVVGGEAAGNFLELLVVFEGEAGGCNDCRMESIAV